MQNYGLQMCAVHGKKRGMQNVQEVAPGQFICRPGMECQAGTPQQQGYMPQQHMGQMDMNLGGLSYGVPSFQGGAMNNGLGGGLGGGLSMGGGGGGMGGMGGGGMGGMGGMGGNAMPINGALNPGMVGGLPFSQLQNPTNKQYCCIHRKERNITSLVEVAPGAKGLRCRSDDECKLGQSQLAATDTMVECSVHGKKRSTNWLECQEDGSWRCKAESECISTVGNEKQMCSEHNKYRAVEVMQQDSEGKWTCKPGSKCKGSNATRSAGVPYARPNYSGGSICSLHNKKRGSKYLVPHPTISGAHTCVPGNECK